MKLWIPSATVLLSSLFFKISYFSDYKKDQIDYPYEIDWEQRSDIRKNKRKYKDVIGKNTKIVLSMKDDISIHSQHDKNIIDIPWKYCLDENYNESLIIKYNKMLAYKYPLVNIIYTSISIGLTIPILFSEDRRFFRLWVCGLAMKHLYLTYIEYKSDIFAANSPNSNKNLISYYENKLEENKKIRYDNFQSKNLYNSYLAFLITRKGNDCFNLFYTFRIKYLHKYL